MPRLPLRWSLPDSQPNRSLDRRAAHYERRLRLAEARADSAALEELQANYDEFLGAWHAQDELHELIPAELPLGAAVNVKPEVRSAIRDRLQVCQQAGLDAELDLYLFAGALYVIGEYAEALTELEGLPGGEAGGAALEVRKGLCLVRMERWYEALHRFECAAELDPGNASALSGKGLALEHLGRSEEALVLHGRALEADPRVAETHFRIAECLSKLGRNPMACLAYDRAVSLAPEHKPYRQHRARALLHEGRLDAALLAYDELLPQAGPAPSLPNLPQNQRSTPQPSRPARRRRRTLRGRWIAAGSLSLGLVAGWTFAPGKALKSTNSGGRPTSLANTSPHTYRTTEESSRTVSFQAPGD